jgi:hypothetical protein
MVIINVLASTISVLLIVTSLLKLRMSLKFKTLFIIGIFTVDLFSSGSSITLLLRVAIGSFILFIYTGDIIHSLFAILMAESTVTLFVFLLGPVFYIIPGYIERHQILFNATMSLYVLVISLITKLTINKHQSLFKHCSKKMKILIICYDLLIILPINTWKAEIRIKYPVIVLLFGITTLFLICYLLSMFIKIQKLEIDLQKKIITWNIGKSSHFTAPTISLMRKYIESNDMEGIKTLYKKHIGPIYKKNDLERQESKLKLIHMELITNYIYDVLSRKDNIELIVDGIFKVESIPEVDLFIIISQYIQNAIEHTDGHNDSAIVIYFLQDHSETAYVEVSNTYYGGPFDIQKIMKPTREGKHMGFGLAYIRELLDKHNLVHQTYVRGNKFIQAIEFKEL